MAEERSTGGGLLAPVLVLVFGSIASAIGFGIGITPDHGNPAAITRMPIPSERGLDLQARTYGLFFTQRNAPSRVALRAPPLSITLHPPDGAPDPGWKEIEDKYDITVGRDHFVQIATIDVHQAGRYTVRVRGTEEQGGSLAIGDTDKEVTSLVPALLYGGFPLTVTLLLTALLGVPALRRRRRGREEEG
jgi:hypothetical protein